MKNLELLEKTGFEAAGNKVKKAQELKRKMTIAYEHFRYVTPEVIEKFNEALKARTLKRSGKEGVNLYHHYDVLKTIPVKQYGKVPPASVLERVAEVIETYGCFDRFEVAEVQSVVEYKDPIIFGRIEGCPDLFYVDQWGDDVKITDLLADGEG